jgi:hypothetical protein
LSSAERWLANSFILFFIKGSQMLAGINQSNVMESYSFGPDSIKYMGYPYWDRGTLFPLLGWLFRWDSATCELKGNYENTEILEINYFLLFIFEFVKYFGKPSLGLHEYTQLVWFSLNWPQNLWDSSLCVV